MALIKVSAAGRILGMSSQGVHHLVKMKQLKCLVTADDGTRLFNERDVRELADKRAAKILPKRAA